MSNIKFLSSVFLTIFISGMIVAQSDPNVSSLMRYEEVPVDLSNGIPDVSVPFVTLPTRSKDITLDIGLKYHLLNGIGPDAYSGDCGLGWNVFAGGVISRTIIGNNDAHTYYYATTSPTIDQSDDIYQFNFMGYYGRFILMLKPDNTLGIKVLKQKDSKLDLKFEYDSHFEITKFTFFDEKGYQYIFDVINNNNNYNSAYYLSSIVDNNAKELVHYSYQACFTPAVIGSYPSKTYNKLTEISTNGFGKITLNYSTTSLNCATAKLSELVLSDTRNNAIKKMKLFGSAYRISRVQISDIAETKKEVYQFTYDSWDYPSNGNAYDMFGFRTEPPCGSIDSNLGVPSSRICKAGALVKMKLPTGGSVIYDYESNSYCKYNKGADNIWHRDDDPNSYYDCLAGAGINGANPLIQENFIPTYFGSGSLPFNFSNTESTYNFTVTATNTFYFTTTGVEYNNPFFNHTTSPDNPSTYFPTFTLTQIIGSYHYNIPHFNDLNYYKDTKSGFCLGQAIQLSPGNYTVTISSINNQYNFGTLEIKTLELNPNPRKWYYGGGVRIKQIGFFNNDAPSDYYSSSYTSISDYNSQGYNPVSEKKYKYNFFGTSYSSGYLVNSDFNIINQNNDDLGYSKMYFGGYKNVTVTDSQNNGREEYVFKDGLDPFDNTVTNSNIIFENSKRGLLLNKKTYDSNGNLLASIDCNYDFSDPETDGGVCTTYPFSTSSYPPNYPTPTTPLLEIGKLTQKNTKNYFGSQIKSVTEYFGYDPISFQLKNHTTTNSLGETLKTEYVFDTNNSPSSQNRIAEPSQTMTYRAGNLLSTNKVSYNNNWGNNQSYQPQTIESARSTGGLEVKKRFNQYDQYSNLLEEQNESGMVSSYIWGYNNTVIVAKLNNMAYNNIPHNLIAAIQSSTDSLSATENDVASTLDALRASTDTNLQKAMITTYTYKPLIGISSVTDAKGDKIFYEYDELGRLIRVRDKDSNIISETQYNLINQN